MRRDISYLKFPNPAEELKYLKKQKTNKTHIKAKGINSQHGYLKTTWIINVLLTKSPYIVRKRSLGRKEEKSWSWEHWDHMEIQHIRLWELICKASTTGRDNVWKHFNWQLSSKFKPFSLKLSPVGRKALAQNVLNLRLQPRRAIKRQNLGNVDGWWGVVIYLLSSLSFKI